MPIYDFKCLNCEHEYEVFLTTFSAAQQATDKEECPKCDSKEKERLVTKGTSFKLKGGGWAKDGYTGGNGGSGD